MSESQESVPFLAPEPAELAPLFPGYTIEWLIATGGMGAVYCAVQKSLDRTVALKILPREFSKDAEFCAGFEAEAKAMARLNHPNLVGVYDFGEADGMLYIVMEFVPGKSIYHSAYGIAIDPEEVIRLITGICNGLAHAHENGIIHRDIKPSNILLDLNAQPKIGDFGLARPAERKVEEGEQIFGTPHYTAPEVVNSPHSVDHRADIFSVGVMLHELLTSHLPAADSRSASNIVRCDARFDKIIRRATHTSPAARYASAAELADELQAIAAPDVSAMRPAAAPDVSAMRQSAASIVAPRRPTVPYHTPTRKKSSGGPVVAFLIFAAIVGAVLFVLKAPKPEEKSLDPIASPVPLPIDSAPAVATSANDGTSGQEPLPEPVIAVNPDAASLPAPAPEAPAAIAPKYDVTAFLDRARGIMQTRARPLITTHQTGLKSNRASFESEITRQFRNEKIEGERIDKVVSRVSADWAGDRIPKALGGNLETVEKMELVHAAYLKREATIDDAVEFGTAQLFTQYLVGLKKQIERLEKDDDPGAISLLTGEIETAQGDAEYFSEKVLGFKNEGD